MHELAERLLKTIRKHEFLRAGDRVAVAVSGGADSVALLLLLLQLRTELGIVLSVAHVNHKLRGAESDEDERFVTELAASLGLDLLARVAEVNRRGGSGIEGSARELRYNFFAELAREGRVTKIATAHTLDDQAETVLLRMLRGTGIRGLAGIHPRLRLNHDSSGVACGEVVRPLLGFRRAELREYLRARGQPWREDSSNQDAAFLRNRVRRRLLPLIVEEFGEAAIEHLAELAEIARAEEEWAIRAQYSAPSIQHAHEKSAAVRRRPPSPDLSATALTLDIAALLALPLAAARRQVRAWIEANAPAVTISFRLIEEVLQLARGVSGKRLKLPCTAYVEKQVEAESSGARIARPKSVRRRPKDLVLEPDVSDETHDYEYALSVPGEVTVPEVALRFEAQVVDRKQVPEQERDGLLDPSRLAGTVVIRNWRAGDRYWPAHSSAEKKVKELLTDRQATGLAKKLWPVAAAAGALVWMRGFAAPAAFRARSGKAIWIRETNLNS